MKKHTLKIAVAGTSVAAAIGLTAAPFAAADDAVPVITTTIGQQGKLVNGNVVQGWTITGLKPSSDAVPHTPDGTLWEATATNEAIQGSVQPIVSNLNARTADGQSYRVLWGVATPQGVNPARLAQGEKTTGKIYFDVTGPAPDRVVYSDAGDDLLVWNPAPQPAASGSGGSGTWNPPSAGSAQRAPAQTAPGATTPAPAAGSAGTPAAGTAPTTTITGVPHGVGRPAS